MSFKLQRNEYLGLEGSNTALFRRLRALPKLFQAPSLHFHTYPQQSQGHLHGKRKTYMPGEVISQSQN